MLSLESVERRLEDPKACCVFHQCFCKAAVGEVRWKECMDNIEERIGNDTTEAFALANNCNAWLCEEKANHGKALWTEHESNAGNKDSIVDRLLCDQEFVLEEGPGELLVHDATRKQTCKKAAKARKDWIRELCHLPVCGEMMR
jgi:hypothetical protein